MAINKTVTIKRVDGSYARITTLRYNKNGMLELGIDLWKDSGDRTTNPSSPLVESYSYFISDEAAKKKVSDLLYSLAEYVPELAGGTAIYDTESVTLDQEKIAMSAGKNATISAVVLPENANDKTLIWDSSATEVATVSGGVVSAIAIGSATITAKTKDRGISATCIVTVEE